MNAFQALEPGSIPGECITFFLFKILFEQWWIKIFIIIIMSRKYKVKKPKKQKKANAFHPGKKPFKSIWFGSSYMLVTFSTKKHLNKYK